MGERALEPKGFLATPEQEGRFWGVVGAALIGGIAVVILVSMPAERKQMALADGPSAIDRTATPR